MAIDFDKATAAELKVFKRNIDMETASPEALASLDELIIDRTVDERMAKVEARIESRSTARKLDSKARSLWPELADTESDLYKKANEILEARGNSNHPNALLDAANMAGIELGMQPANSRAGNTATPGVKPGGSGNQDGEAEPSGFIKRTSKIAHAYRDLIDVSDPKVAERIETTASDLEGEKSNG